MTQNVDLSVIEAMAKGQIEAIEKKYQALLDAQAEAITKAAEAKYEAQLTDLASRVEKAEQEKAEATEARQKREYFEKAAELRTLGVGRTELADKMFALSKSVSKEDMAYWEELLKTVDHNLFEAGFFSEFGSSRTPDEVAIEEKVQKAAKEQGVSFEEALLKLSPAEKEQLRREWDKASRGGA